MSGADKPSVRAGRLSIAEHMAHCTVRIQCGGPRGSSFGTGFFFEFAKQDDLAVPAIVTNWHVVEAATEGRMRLTQRNPGGGPKVGAGADVEISEFQSAWIRHPDPSVDLCVLPLAPLLRRLEELGRPPFYASADMNLIPRANASDTLDALEDITIVGYPIGLWDEHNNLPLFRRGITATNPAIDLGGRPEFLIDAAILPGSSGSPVFIYNRGAYNDKFGATLVTSGRLILLGIVYARIVHEELGRPVAKPAPTADVAIMTDFPTSLGVALKAETLRAFDDHFVERRQRATQSESR